MAKTKTNPQLTKNTNARKNPLKTTPKKVLCKQKKFLIFENKFIFEKQKLKPIGVILVLLSTTVSYKYFFLLISLTTPKFNSTNLF